jgi:hypothetical protein
MKWKKVLNLLFLVLLSVFFFGCFGTKKTKTITVTETKIKIDTIIKIQNDTIIKYQTVTIHDTAILENNTSIARSYFSQSKQRIVLELKGKSFDVPVSIYKSVKQVAKEKETVREPLIKDKYIWWFFIIVIAYLIWKDRKSLFEKRIP